MESIVTGKNLSKEDIYEAVMPQISSLIGNESDVIAAMANTSAALKEAFDFFWVGFYVVKDKELVLGPFQGSVACSRIGFGKGVCGIAWKEIETQIVDDVDMFPGHIACNSLSRSEIVIPIIKDNEVKAVLDIDSDRLALFDNTDKLYLEKLCSIIAVKF